MPKIIKITIDNQNLTTTMEALSVALQSTYDRDGTWLSILLELGDCDDWEAKQDYHDAKQEVLDIVAETALQDCDWEYDGFGDLTPCLPDWVKERDCYQSIYDDVLADWDYSDRKEHGTYW